VKWLDLAPHLWLSLLELPLAKMVRVHYDYMVKYYKPLFEFLFEDCYWFIQYMHNDNGDVHNSLPSLNMQFESFYSASFFLLQLLYISICFHPPLFSNIDFCLQLVWTIVHKLQDDFCSSEREKMKLASLVFISRWCWYCCIFFIMGNKKFPNTLRIWH
jgi:hypothetical protein